ncbi:MAG: TRAP transporter small permease subunit [Betaproteobacteria bacterium]|jgi:TRAP-type C4-dicarboxylate transport system permease small subunit|nr:TRAP transporter small permease subunit [Betaproteobacteria bacterium]
MSVPAAEAAVHAPGVMRRLEQIGLGVSRALSALGLSALLFLALLTLVDGLARWLLNQPLEGVRDVAAVAIALAVSCCLPVGLMERSNIVIRTLPLGTWPRTSRALDAVAAILVVLIMGAMAWQFMVFAGKMAKAGETTWILKIPTAPFWYGVSAILVCAVLVQTIVVVLELGRCWGQFEHSERSQA